MAPRVPARLSPAEGRQFGLTVGGAFLVLATLAWWRGRQGVLITTGTLGSMLVVAGLALPGRLGPVRRAWMAAARAVSAVTTPVVISLIYFLVFTPTALLLRAFGHRAIARNRAQSSFWVSRGARTRSDLQRQF